ncbi:MAG TPA: TonB-dependent receptor, partial [Gammaproteobacteria bacterium]
DEVANSIRIGAKQQWSRDDALLGSLIVQDVSTSLDNGNEYDFRLEQQGYSADLQHIRTGRSVQIQSGIVYARQDENSVTRLAFPGLPPMIEGAGESSQLGVYSYAHFNPSAALTLTAGASFDEIDDTFVEDQTWNPKLGVIWRPNARTTLRAAALEVLFGSLTTSTQNPQPRLEPVQVAGFTQLLFGGRADRSKVGSLAIEHEFSSRVFVGWEATERDTDRVAIDAFAQPGDPLIEIALNERGQQAYLYWTPGDRVSVSTRYEHGRFKSDPGDFSGYSEMTTRRLPLELRYFTRGGLTLGARATYVEQEGVFMMSSSTPGPPALQPGHDRFGVLDAFIGYRLPNRRGLLSLNADNLLDESFQFQDIDPTNPSIMPERLVSFRFTLAFD